MGFLYLLLNVIIAIFIGSLMIRRTPELLGKKGGIPEVQIATLVILILPFLYLAATEVAVATKNGHPDIGWLSNGNAQPSGIATMLYEYVSSAAGNGSGFEGLNDNNPFWNVSTALVMLFEKRFIPPTTGVLSTESWTFGLLLTIISTLNSFPALAIGPVAECSLRMIRP